MIYPASHILCHNFRQTVNYINDAFDIMIIIILSTIFNHRRPLLLPRDRWYYIRYQFILRYEVKCLSCIEISLNVFLYQYIFYLEKKCMKMFVDKSWLAGKLSNLPKRVCGTRRTCFGIRCLLKIITVSFSYFRVSCPDLYFCFFSLRIFDESAPNLMRKLDNSRNMFKSFDWQ